jgi:regulator of RNase E activity RraA
MPENSHSGIRIFLNTPRPTPAQVASFRHVPIGNICDAMDHLGAMNHRIKPLDSSSKMCGPALTVRVRPGDNLMVWKGVEIAQPGDVLVIATYGYETTSTLGELVVMAARAKGLAGIVCDGMGRDAVGIRSTGLPVFTAGLVPSAPGRDGPGEVGAPVTCGGAVVQSGDLIVGDEEGVVVIPRIDLDAVTESLALVEKFEAKLLADIQAGKLIPEWVDEIIAAKGYEVVELAEIP